MQMLGHAGCQTLQQRPSAFAKGRRWTIEFASNGQGDQARLQLDADRLGRVVAIDQARVSRVPDSVTRTKGPPCSPPPQTGQGINAVGFPRRPAHPPIRAAQFENRRQIRGYRWI